MAEHSVSLKPLNWLLLTGCLFNGLLAGENVFRYLIEVPAWSHLNPLDWAEYCRHADLANGIILFPFEAIAATIILLAASVIVIRDTDQLPVAVLLTCITTMLVLVGIGLTFLAAPLMLSLKADTRDIEKIRLIFERFHFWGGLRALAQILSFFTNLIALMLVNNVNRKH